MSEIARNLIQLAADEGIEVALDEAQKIQEALENLNESLFDPMNVQAVTVLLNGVNSGIENLLSVKVSIQPRCGCGVETPHEPGEDFCYSAVG